MPTDIEIKELASAMWQLLDDIGHFAAQPCVAAVAKARLAYEPFHNIENDGEMDVSLEEAAKIVAEVEAAR